MRPSATRAASARRDGAEPAPRLHPWAKALVAALAALLPIATPSLAGDRALIDFIGFSPDFRYFAFEEFGIQDGSGFAYANLYVVDLSRDDWVAGTPIRVRADDERRPLAAIRAEAAAGAAGHLAELGIDVPVEVAALIGDGVPDIDAKSLVFGAPGYQPGAVLDRHALALATFETAAASPCADWFGTAPLGFALTLSGEGTETLLHRDAALPRSRGCPLDYRLYGVVMPFTAPVAAHAVAIISVYPGGFEGPDRRFLAVPLGR
ncbi:DUF2259 domain-containing protein [Devosia honganensis]|uniref:DUF2259 domain-containing protein n=1 Tax=Devosia honganensis TaxID=1610527 RepID=A0ABV7X1S0_9HYPH